MIAMSTNPIPSWDGDAGTASGAVAGRKRVRDPTTITPPSRSTPYGALHGGAISDRSLRAGGSVPDDRHRGGSRFFQGNSLRRWVILTTDARSDGCARSGLRGRTSPNDAPSRSGASFPSARQSRAPSPGLSSGPTGGMTPPRSDCPRNGAQRCAWLLPESRSVIGWLILALVNLLLLPEPAMSAGRQLMAWILNGICGIRTFPRCAAQNLVPNRNRRRMKSRAHSSSCPPRAT